VCQQATARQISPINHNQSRSSHLYAILLWSTQETNHDTTWSHVAVQNINECLSDFYQPRPKKWHGLDCVDDMDLILIRWPVWTGTNLVLFSSFLGAWIIGYHPGTALIWPLHNLNTNITLTPPQLQLLSTLLTPPKSYQLNRHPHHNIIGKRVSALCQTKAPQPLHFVAQERGGDLNPNVRA
jgi:hypothetical protein